MYRIIIPRTEALRQINPEGRGPRGIYLASSRRSRYLSDLYYCTRHCDTYMKTRLLGNVNIKYGVYKELRQFYYTLRQASLLVCTTMQVQGKSKW